MQNKGDCYVVAYQEQQKYKGSLLVHGLVNGQGRLKGIKYNHAWIEIDDKVIDRTIQNEEMKEMDKEIYYALGNIETTYKYDFLQVIEKSLEIETYGPWEDELLENEH